MSWVLVNSDALLERALEALQGATEIAVDTEFMRRNTYYPQVALLQLCSDDNAWLIDPLAVSDTAGVVDLLTDSAVTKILHSCSEDLEVFRRWLGVMPAPLVDTQRALALTGDDHGLGYRAMVQTLLGVELDKGETRSDWLKRPLTDSQCHYAAQDVLYLLRAWHILHERIEGLGRMPWVLEDGAECARALLERERDQHRRIKASGRLDGRQLAVLERISRWREERAKAVDKPRKWVLDDAACVAIARSMPASEAALAGVGDLPPSVLRKQGAAIVEAVKEALALPASELPVQNRGALSPQQRQRVKEMRDLVRSRAAELEVAPELLFSAGDVDLLLRQSSGQAISEPERWRGWREEQIVVPLRELAGRS